MSKCHVRTSETSGVQTIPRVWLMTDERMGDALLPSIAALPRRSGIIFRHYGLAPAPRHELLRSVAAQARRHGHLLLIGGPALNIHRWLYAGRHGRVRGALTTPVHSRREAVAAQRACAQLLFVSPLFATRSHPGARSLGRSRFGLMIRGLSAGVIALGGMNDHRARGLRPMKIRGWAGIDALVVNV